MGDDAPVSIIYIVKNEQNLTACDDFNEDTFTGSTQRTLGVYGFNTMDEAQAFYRKRKTGLTMAGLGGEYYTSPVKRELSTDPKRSVVIECVCEADGYYKIYCPAKKVICGKCDGDGSHVDPAIDGNGLDEESLSDPEFMQEYMGGRYDVRCEECHGNKIILVPELDDLPQNIANDYWRSRDEIAQLEADAADEIRRGC